MLRLLRADRSEVALCWERDRWRARDESAVSKAVAMAPVVVDARDGFGIADQDLSKELEGFVVVPVLNRRESFASAEHSVGSLMFDDASVAY